MHRFRYGGTASLCQDQATLALKAGVYSVPRGRKKRSEKIRKPANISILTVPAHHLYIKTWQGNPLLNYSVSMLYVSFIN